jgi:uncharacterized iron-regulated membrane protein
MGKVRQCESFRAKKAPIQGNLAPQVSAMLETRRDLHRSWYDYNWDWALISLLALVLLAGIVLWTNVHQSQTAIILDDATTGQSIRPSLPTPPN